MSLPGGAQPSALLEQIAGVENLTRAWQQVRRNIKLARHPTSRGSDAVSIADFEADWTHQMETLAEELRSGRYRPLPPRQLLIPKRAGGQRLISVLAVRDRVAQRALLQVLEPLFEPTFLPCSYGCRPEIGAPHALLQVDSYRRQGKTWAIHADIADFFPHIDHGLLLRLVRRRIKERDVLALITAWLEARVLDPRANDDASAWWERGEALMERAVAWGRAEVLRRVDPAAAVVYDAELDPAELLPGAPADIDLEERASRVRQQAWRAVAGEAALLALTYARPMLNGARRVAPALLHLGGHPVLAVAAGAGFVLLPPALLAWRVAQRGGERGTIQGGALSPLLANVYLDPFDRALTARGHTLVRYMDDFLLLGSSRGEVEAALQEVRRQLARLRLQLNEAKTTTFTPEEPLLFLGCALPPVRPPPAQHWPSFAAAEQTLQGARQRGQGALRRLRHRPGGKKPDHR
jgi:RNA-directed DNA polymerase